MESIQNWFFKKLERLILKWIMDREGWNVLKLKQPYMRPILVHNFYCAMVANYLKCPFSPGVFCPSVSGHKWPLCETITGIFIIWSCTEDHGTCTHGGSEENFHVSPSGSIQGDESLDMFQVIDFRFRPCAAVRLQGQKQWFILWDSSGKKDKRFLCKES